MVTAGYLVLVALVGLQRLHEVRISRRHEEALRARGGIEHAPHQMPVMIGLHTAWIVACVAEPLAIERAPSALLGALALVAFCAGQALRWSARQALGHRWTVRVITLPGAPRITTGPFRYLNHPNYAGVAIEIASLPLVHGAWMTAAVFSAANALLLAWRVRAENRALLGAG